MQLNKSSGDSQQFCVISALWMCFIFHYCSQYIWYGRLNPSSKRCAIIIDQDNIVGIKSRDLWLLHLFTSDENSFFLLSFNCQQNHVAGEADTLLIINVNDARRFSFCHRFFTNFTIVYDSKPRHLPNFITYSGRVESMTWDWYQWLRNRSIHQHFDDWKFKK